MAFGLGSSVASFEGLVFRVLGFHRPGAGVRVTPETASVKAPIPKSIRYPHPKQHSRFGVSLVGIAITVWI